jgi:hypothetical protein
VPRRAWLFGLLFASGDAERGALLPKRHILALEECARRFTRTRVRD